jgi:hypothetical protein
MKLSQLLDVAFANTQDERLDKIGKMLTGFMLDAQEVEIGTKSEFNLEMLDLFRRHSPQMTETGRVILLNIIRFFELTSE